MRIYLTREECKEYGLPKDSFIDRPAPASEPEHFHNPNHDWQVYA